MDGRVVKRRLRRGGALWKQVRNKLNAQRPQPLSRRPASQRLFASPVTTVAVLPARGESPFLRAMLRLLEIGFICVRPAKIEGLNPRNCRGLVHDAMSNPPICSQAGRPFSDQDPPSCISLFFGETDRVRRQKTNKDPSSTSPSRSNAIRQDYITGPASAEGEKMASNMIPPKAHSKPQRTLQAIDTSFVGGMDARSCRTK